MMEDGRVRTEGDKQAQAARIRRLRQAGETWQEIADRFGLPAATVRSRACRFFSTAELEGPWGRRGRRSGLVANAEDPRHRQVVELLQRGDAGAVRRLLGVSCQRVHQIRTALQQQYPHYGLGRRPEGLLTLRVVARRLRSSTRSADMWLRRAGCPAVGRWGRCKYYEPTVVRSVRAAREAARERVCAVCGRMFQRAGIRGGSPRACSPVCRQAWRQLAARDGAVLKTWYALLWETVRQQPLPDVVEWVGLAEAVRRSGLTIMQVIRLRYRGLVRTCPHPTRRWRGKPDHLYAANDVARAGEVAQEWRQRENRLVP